MWKPNSISAYKQLLNIFEVSAVCDFYKMASKRRQEDEQITQELYLHSDSDETLTSGDSDQTNSDTEVDRQNDRSMWTASTRPTVPLIHRFTGASSGLRLHEAPHIGKESTAFSVLMPFFQTLSNCW
jgi:hypothetical protein